MSNNKTVFISGKISGLPFAQAMAKFKTIEHLIRSNGFKNVFNPLAEISQELSYEEQMKICIAEVKKRDIIFQIDDWTESAGARRECVAAIHFDKAITNINTFLHDIKTARYSTPVLDNQRG